MESMLHPTKATLDRPHSRLLLFIFRLLSFLRPVPAPNHMK